MKKRISDKKLEEMLTNLYSSKPKYNFQFRSSALPDKVEETQENSEFIVSGAEVIRHRRFSPSRICAAAASLLLVVGVGGMVIGDMCSDRISSPMTMPETWNEDVDAISKNTVSDEEALFDEYLAEFEYEISNFDYKCIKVTPQYVYSDNNDEQRVMHLDRYKYAEMCYDFQMIPAYENCKIINTFNEDSSVETNEEFYCYIKQIQDVTVTQGDETFTTAVDTRQAYLIWKDENGNITKIRPSAEKVTAEDIANRLDFNGISSYDANQHISELMNSFEDETNEVYINGSLVRPSIPEEKQVDYSVNVLAGTTYMYVMNNGVLTPVTVSSVKYSSGSIKYDGEEGNDEGKRISYINNDIPMFEGIIDDERAFIRVAFFNDCSKDELVDISAMIEERNSNYWLETAECGTYTENLSIYKEYVLNHMINAVDFFDTVEGTFTVSMTAGNEKSVSYIINLSDNTDEQFIYESYFDYEKSTEFYKSNNMIYNNTDGNISGEYIKNQIDRGEYKQVSEFMDKAYRTAGMNYAEISLMNQELASELLSDTSTWEITKETIEEMGCSCVLIEGKSNDNIYGIDIFTLIVEKNTGIIIEFEGYDSAGELCSYISTKNISINQGTSKSREEFDSEMKQIIKENISFVDLAGMDDETIDSLIETFGDALQRTDTGFTLCSYCLEQNNQNMEVYPGVDFSMDIVDFYNNAQTNDKYISGICYDIPDLGVSEAVISPEGNFRISGYEYEDYKVGINGENYSMTVYFPNNSINYSEEEKERNETFHNMPWAEIIFNDNASSEQNE